MRRSLLVVRRDLDSAELSAGFGMSVRQPLSGRGLWRPKVQSKRVPRVGGTWLVLLAV